MLNWILNKLGLQRIPEEQRRQAASKDKYMQPWDRRLFKMSHKRRFETAVDKLIKVVEAANNDSFHNYKIDVDGYRFAFKRCAWTDFTVDTPDAWLVRSKLGDHLEYNILRLDENDQENWWRLANAAEAAIEEVKCRDQELQAKTTMDMIMRAD